MWESGDWESGKAGENAGQVCVAGSGLTKC